MDLCSHAHGPRPHAHGPGPVCIAHGLGPMCMGSGPCTRIDYRAKRGIWFLHVTPHHHHTDWYLMAMGKAHDGADGLDGSRQCHRFRAGGGKPLVAGMIGNRGFV